MFVLGVMGTCFLGDPYLQFSRKYGDNDGRTLDFSSRRIWANATIARLSTGDYDTIFIGNSRTRIGMNPDYIDGTRRAYNASFSALTYENIYMLLMPVLKRTKIKTIVLGVDFGMERMSNDFTADRYTKANVWRSLLGIYSFMDALEVLKQKMGTDTRYPVLPNGLYIKAEQNLTPRQYRKIAKTMIKEFQTHIGEPLENSRGWSYFKAIVQKCKEERITLKLAISPIHASLLEAIYSGGLADDFENWIRQVVAVAHGDPMKQKVPPAAVWLFCGYQDWNTEAFPDHAAPMTYYFESSHYRPRIGNRLLAQIFNLKGTQKTPEIGVQLTPENVNESLSTLRQQREKFIRTHDPEALWGSWVIDR